MAKSEKYELVPDKKGATWDLLMYIPVVIVLVSIALKLCSSPLFLSAAHYCIE